MVHHSKCCSILNPVVYDKFDVALMVLCVCKREEDMVGKRENAGHSIILYEIAFCRAL